MSRAKTAKVGRPEKAKLVQRVNRIGGQVEGIARMIEQDRYCIDILTQLAAARSALDALGLELLHGHAQGCLQQAIRSGEGAAAVDEMMRVVRRFSR